MPECGRKLLVTRNLHGWLENERQTKNGRCQILASPLQSDHTRAVRTLKIPLLGLACARPAERP